jgi:hypothetical protein
MNKQDAKRVRRWKQREARELEGKRAIATFIAQYEMYSGQAAKVLGRVLGRTV